MGSTWDLASGSAFERIISDLSHRVTSKVGEEAICVASMLGMDPTPMLLEKPDARVGALFLFLREAPAHFAFLVGPHYEDVGMPWIPRSLLMVSSTAQPSQSANGEIIGEIRKKTDGVMPGFRVRLPGLRFKHGSPQPKSGNLLPIEIRGVQHIASLQSDKTDDEKWSKYTIRDMAIICLPCPEENVQSQAAMLAMVAAEQDGMISVISWCEVRFVLLSSITNVSNADVKELKYVLLEDQDWLTC